MAKGALLWGFILVLAGVLLLLDNLGIIHVNVWGLIWPLFMIALGVRLTLDALSRKQTSEAEEVEIPLDSATSARIRIRHGAGRLQLDDSAGESILISGSFGGGIQHRVKREGEVLEVEMSAPVDWLPRIFLPWTGLHWRVSLNREIPLTISLETGAGESLLDLSGLQVTNLHLKTGASSTEVTLPARAGHTYAEVKAGAASVTINIPDGVAARIHATGGLASFNVNTARFPRQNGYYQSPGYENADNRVELKVEAGMGSVEIR